MPYSASAAAHRHRESADTDAIDTILRAEEKANTEAPPPLRRSRSASDAEPLPSPVASTSAAAGIYVSPPTPTTTAVPSASSAIPSISQVPVLPRSSPSPRSATQALPRTSRSVSPNPSSRAPSALGITIHANVLPEVRSPPRRPVDTLQITSRRSRRPRLFGFTGINDDIGSAASSATSSPEDPSSPVTAPVPLGSVLPRRYNPVRTRSETSLSTLPQVSPPPPRQRRGTGLRLDLGNIVAPNISQPVSAGIVQSPYHGVVKKKSGEIVRPALKYVGELLPNGTPADKSRPMFESKSCPTTPSCPKYVHFDSQLEHVKLFLQNQKPLVVSRQGTPTEEMSENEMDEAMAEAAKVLQIRLPNFPTDPPTDADIFLESLFLSETRDTLRGKVCVKNIAFEKWVAVRFTFDWWQTTSEVSAGYKESIRGGLYDRFEFSIKLSDILDRIEEKTLFLCMRYSVPGREIWDSNSGQNYQVLFERKAPDSPKYMPKRAVTVPQGMGRARGSNAWSLTGNDNDRMADLRAKLNRLTSEDMELNAPLSPSKKKPSRSPRSPRMSPRRAASSPGAGPGADLPVMSELANRYDFGSALKSSRRASPPKGQNLDLPAAAGPSNDFYSPRIDLLTVGGGPVSPISPIPGAPASPLAGPASPLGPSSPLANLRSADSSPTIRLPSLTSGTSSSSTSLSSVSSITATPTQSPALDRRHVEVTPSDTSSASASPLSPPSDSSFSSSDSFPWSPTSKLERSTDDMNMASYAHFIEQFCWAGGVSSPDTPASTSDSNVRRVHSTSSLDHYFSSPPEASTPRVFTPTPGVKDSVSATGGGTGSTATPSAYRASRASPPTREDLDHVDNAIRSLTSSLTSTPVEGSPVISPAMSRIPSSSGGAVLAA
ncbi:hypothetical protein VHUM_03196 [Vanrija humicola]|uniref:CBM21 domain-containing protein n=1 Tax=Vanrija humicola TaxID=5417 RepID=A0A7D8UY89_VANHU|nr:hypothetical protein VHUM_03196 [Vanrija humicola]